MAFFSSSTLVKNSGSGSRRFGAALVNLTVRIVADQVMNVAKEDKLRRLPARIATAMFVRPHRKPGRSGSVQRGHIRLFPIVASAASLAARPLHEALGLARGLLDRGYAFAQLVEACPQLAEGFCIPTISSASRRKVFSIKSI